VNRYGNAADKEHQEEQADEEQMDDESGDQLDQRQNADAEGHLLYQETVFKD